MMRLPHLLQMLVVPCAVVGLMHAQQPDAAQVAQERRQAEIDGPKLVEALELKPGMTVADVGSGFGAMTVVLGHWIGSGRVFATDITERALRQTREYVKSEGLANVTVVEGAEAATNLPDERSAGARFYVTWATGSFTADTPARASIPAPRA